MQRRRFAAIALSALLAAAWTARCAEYGTMAIRNLDSSEHSVEVDRSSRILNFIEDAVDSPDFAVIPGGGTASTSLEPGQWTVYGDGSPRFSIMINLDQHYDFTLQPVSQQTAYGLEYTVLGVVDDGYHSSSYQLFDLVQSAPQVVVPGPPVVFSPQPSYHYPPPPLPPRDSGRELGEAIGSAVFHILGEALSDNDRHHRRRDRDRDHDRRPPPPHRDRDRRR